MTNMDHQIEKLAAAESEWISQQLEAAAQFVTITNGNDTQDLPSPEELDQAFHTWLNSPTHNPSEANSVINCVGIAFGQHLVDRTPLEWVIASDQYGTELAVYGLPGQGDILVYPQNFVAKRYEAKIGTFIAESINRIQTDVSNIQNRNQQKKWWKPW